MKKSTKYGLLTLLGVAGVFGAGLMGPMAHFGGVFENSLPEVLFNVATWVAAAGALIPTIKNTGRYFQAKNIELWKEIKSAPPKVLRQKYVRKVVAAVGLGLGVLASGIAGPMAHFGGAFQNVLPEVLFNVATWVSALACISKSIQAMGEAGEVKERIKKNPVFAVSTSQFMAAPTSSLRQKAAGVVSMIFNCGRKQQPSSGNGLNNTQNFKKNM